jgi:hypothetical protein
MRKLILAAVVTGTLAAPALPGGRRATRSSPSSRSTGSRRRPKRRTRACSATVIRSAPSPAGPTTNAASGPKPAIGFSSTCHLPAPPTIRRATARPMRRKAIASSPSSTVCAAVQGRPGRGVEIRRALRRRHASADAHVRRSRRRQRHQGRYLHARDKGGSSRCRSAALDERRLLSAISGRRKIMGNGSARSPFSLANPRS